jgi:hypothetical protein
LKSNTSVDDSKSLSILKSIWKKQSDGKWSIHDLKGLALKPRAECDSSFFRFESAVELMTSAPGGLNVHEVFTSFGTTDFLVKQSVLPVIAWTKGKSPIRCIGTAFVVSCTGHLITATHVLLDPIDRGYAKVVRKGGQILYPAELNMGVLVPLSPAYGQSGYRFFPFLYSSYWGEWEESPLLHEQPTFKFLTDVAICKISQMTNGAAHQPLNLSLRGFALGERAFVLGYAGMEDMPFETRDGQMVIPEVKPELHVSVGNVVENFPENHVLRDVPTPGPCFHFRAKVPGRMSGGPIFGADGAVVRGVVSRSFSGEAEAYGAMLGPSLHLPQYDGRSFKNLMDAGGEGIPILQGNEL